MVLRGILIGVIAVLVLLVFVGVFKILVFAGLILFGFCLGLVTAAQRDIKRKAREE